MRLAIRVIVVAVSLFFGALFAIGAIIAALLESDGFTSAAANGARPGYLLLLMAGLIASIAVPSTIAVWLFPDDRRTFLAAGAVFLITGLALFGLVIT